jgi:hypothetical protein
MPFSEVVTAAVSWDDKGIWLAEHFDRPVGGGIWITRT